MALGDGKIFIYVKLYLINKKKLFFLFILRFDLLIDWYTFSLFYFPCVNYKYINLCGKSVRKLDFPVLDLHNVSSKNNIRKFYYSHKTPQKNKKSMINLLYSNQNLLGTVWRSILGNNIGIIIQDFLDFLSFYFN